NFDDAVAMGSYPIDCHACQRFAEEADVVREGGMNTKVPPYPISYRSLCPLPQDARNLLVPVCLSASHVAFGSIRMEPVYMALGHAAGLAAARAATRGVAVQEVDVAAVRAVLRQAGQVLDWDPATSQWHGEWAHDPYVVQSYQWWLD
ncbi:MAG TPA: FAD-dependent oxidoreductase, partial [Polyangiaceae bacterium]